MPSQIHPVYRPIMRRLARQMIFAAANARGIKSVAVQRNLPALIKHALDIHCRTLVLAAHAALTGPITDEQITPRPKWNPSGYQG